MDKLKKLMKKVNERVPTWALLALAALVALVVTIGFDTLLQVISIGIVLAILSWSYLSDVKARTELATQQSDNARIDELCRFFLNVSFEFVRRDDIALMFCLVKPSSTDSILMNQVGSFGSCTVWRFYFPRPYDAPKLEEEHHREFGNSLQQYVTNQLYNSLYAPLFPFYGNTPVLQIISVFSSTQFIYVDVAVMHNGKCWEDFMKVQNSPPPSQDNDSSDWEF